MSDAIRRFKQSRRARIARAELLQRRRPGALAPRPHGLGEPVVVSLTSYAARFGTLADTLVSLLFQTVQADRTILWLAPDDVGRLPQNVRDLQSVGLTIATSPDMRAYTKIIPTLIRHPDCTVVTADDDVWYRPTWLEELTTARLQTGAAVVCHRAHRVGLDPHGQPLSYNDWEMNLRGEARGPLVFPTGVMGVLYAPGIFHRDTCKPEIFQRLSSSNDDIWLYWMYRLMGHEPFKIGGRQRIIEWPGTQTQSLRAENVVQMGNDDNLRAMIDRYGFPR